jgi:CRISPR-associated protein (TIGR03984 family)
MQRQIKNHRAQATPLLQRQSALPNSKELRAWLEEQVETHASLNLQWLLAHADDGVIWGVVRDGALITFASVPDVSPPLRLETLQQVRLFSSQGELMVWRDGDNFWNARLLCEVQADEDAAWFEAFDEPQMLWGTHGQHFGNFTLLRDGAQGLRHAVPQHLPLEENGKTTPPLLWVRHYLAEEDFARVEASRLLRLGDENDLGTTQ